MAPPKRTGPQPWRALAALAVLIVVMLIGITGKDTFNPSKWHSHFKVGLGLDLSSGTQVTLQAVTANGSPPTSGSMSQAISIMESRVNGTGNTGAQVQQIGPDQINVSVPGKGSQQVINLVSTTAQLRMRQVLLEANGLASATPSTKASPSPTASPSASSSASPTPTASTRAKITHAGTSAAGQALTAGARAVASPSPTASASPHASTSPTPTASPSPASSSSAVGDASKVTPSVLKLFDKLVCKPGTNGNVNDSWKATAGYTSSTQWDDVNSQIVSCDASGTKYVLDKPVVLGKDVSGATAGIAQNQTYWQVNLSLDGKAAGAFGKLTTQQYDSYYQNGQYQTNANDSALDQIAIVLDGNVVSAPLTEGAIVTGQAQITGNFSQQQATQLANVLKYGALPLTFKLQNVSSVSAQLGHSSLTAGLIAAIIGLALVVAYSFLYYRGLGLVSVSSLIIAGLLAYLSVVLLSEYQSFTMSLSAIAGLVVAIGITADSFVVFFERLRDEVREGKALRPAVESGWKRARRTILVSDTVSFLAAVLLYHFAVGDVQGFAYTLGLTTIIDVIVVFLFTKPMVTLLAGTKFFSSGHPLSGLDPARLGARAPWRSGLPRTTRTGTGTPRTTARRSAGSRSSSSTTREV